MPYGSKKVKIPKPRPKKKPLRKPIKTGIATNGLSAMASIVENKLGKEAVPQAKRVLDDLTKDGLIDRTVIAEAIKNLISFGFTVEESNKLLEANKDIAIENGKKK